MQRTKAAKSLNIVVVTVTVLVRFLSAHLCLQTCFAFWCRVCHCLSAARSAALSLDFCLACFYFIFLLYCILSVEINCQYICTEFWSKPLRKYFLERQIPDTPPWQVIFFLYTFCVGNQSWIILPVSQVEAFLWVYLAFT